MSAAPPKDAGAKDDLIVRRERRMSLASALTLGCVMAAHVLLETAGDALFLANVAVEHLPFVTIAIAFLAVAAAQGPVGRSHRGALAALQTLGGIGTLGLWVLIALSDPASWTFYLLYIWPSLVTTLVVVRFWLLLAESFTIIQGKRLYASIAMGGSLGALLGAGLATALSARSGGEGLLLASGLLYLTSALGPAVLMRGAQNDRSESADGDGSDIHASLVESLNRVRKHPYARRVAGLAIAASFTLTLGDYLFKSVMAAEIEPERLAVILSQIYLALNLLSITMLAIGVTPLVRRVGVDRALALLPTLVGLAGLGVLAGGAFAATILLKAADGTLRYSLHKTATELLYLPMSASLRNAVKSAIDIIGQASGKASASLLILGLVLLPDSRVAIAIAAMASAALWAWGALQLRHSYLDNFRSTLSEGSIETAIDHPELDLDSVGSLIRALSDPDERRALAAIRLLSESGRLSLVPSLVLYHPSPAVVVQALDAFALARRDDLTHLLDHLLDHGHADVRAAAVRASWVLGQDATGLRPLLESNCLVVRVSAAAGMVALKQDEVERYSAILDEVIEYPEDGPRLAVAMASRLHYHPASREALVTIAQDRDPAAAREAVRAMADSDDAYFTEPLVSLLGDRRIRDEVRSALLNRKGPALAVLEEQLTNRDTPIWVVRHIPRTISRFGTPEAANVLISSLPQISSGMVRYKAIRGLEMLRLEFARRSSKERQMFFEEVEGDGIRAEFDRTLARSLEILRFEAILSKAQVLAPESKTSVGMLLVELLRDKRVLATSRLFTMLGLLNPLENFNQIQDGLSSSNLTERASAAELIETLLPNDVATEVLGLASAGAPDELLARTKTSFDPNVDFADALRALAADPSKTVRAVALYYSDELSLDQVAEGLPDALLATVGGSPTENLSIKERALDLLRDFSTEAPPLSSGSSRPLQSE
ncbi:MAG: Npt1/Npt2 family nucleotide transporter [Myxococcota bacterium]